MYWQVTEGEALSPAFQQRADGRTLSERPHLRTPLTGSVRSCLLGAGVREVGGRGRGVGDQRGRGGEHRRGEGSRGGVRGGE